MTKTRLTTLGALATLAAAGAAHADVTIYETDFEKPGLGPEWSNNCLLDSQPGFTQFNGRHSDRGITLSLLQDPPPDGGGKTGGLLGKVGAGGGISPIGKIKVGGGDNGGGGGDNGGGGGDNGGGDGGGDDGGGDHTPHYTLKFDLYAFDSWDGDGPNYGPDIFEVQVNGLVLLRETISNGDKPQSMRAPDVGPEHMAYSSAWADSIYRNITLTFDHPGDANRLNITWFGKGLQGVYDESWAIDNVSLTTSTRSVPVPGTLLPAAAALGLAARRRRG
ncbi:MAG: hypothetical protein ACF8LK_10390 [Phycisphaerales bacterium JB041]